MIIDAGFSNDMHELLAEMKGKTFKSYECVDLDRFGAFMLGFRLNLGRSAIDVSCDYHPLEGDPAGFDEPTWFACSAANPDSALGRYLEEHSRQYMVDETITGVKIVRDSVEYPNDQVVMNMDIALVLRTKYHTYCFARGAWFSNVLSVSVSDADDHPSNIESIEELWLEEDESAKVTRSTIVL